MLAKVKKITVEKVRLWKIKIFLKQELNEYSMEDVYSPDDKEYPEQVWAKDKC